MKKILRITAKTLGVIIGLLLVGYLVIFLVMRSRMNKPYTFAPETIAIVRDSAAIANGRHLVAIRGCNDCHGANLAGKVMKDDAMLGRLCSSNLTHGKGGLPAGFSVANWLLALRHGVDTTGRPLLLMPSHETAQFSKKDLADIIAYAESLPPVDNVLPAQKIGPVINVMAFLNKFPLLSVERINHQTTAADVTAVPGSAEQGKYLIITCQGCHRTNMKGGDPLAPGFPPVPDVTATGATGRMNLAAFQKVLRTGIKPDGRQLKNENMPWQMTALYTDEEIKAIYTYLRSQ